MTNQTPTGGEPEDPDTLATYNTAPLRYPALEQQARYWIPLLAEGAADWILGNR